MGMVKFNPQVVLFKPENPLNIGSIARGMCNMGFSNLTMVDPVAANLTQAEVTALRAKALLKKASILNSLDEAFNETDFVVGFSTKEGKNTPPVIDLPDLSEALLAQSSSHPSFLFGPESIGLTYRELPYCSLLVRIPSSEEFDSLNLAQAVLLALYEVRRYMIQSDPPHVRRFNAPLISYDVLSKIITECAELSNFHTRGTPKRVTELLTNIFRRTTLSPREAKIMLGFFSRISKALKK